MNRPVDTTLQECVALLQRDDFGAAAALAQSMLESHGEVVAFWHLLGLARLSAGQLAEAEAALREATTRAPGLAAAWDHLGVALHRGGKHAEAARAYDRALTLNPNSPFVLSNAAANAADWGCFDAATIYAERALALDPQQGLAKFVRGNLLLRKGQYREARNLLECAIQRMPNSVEALFSLAEATLKLGDVDSALQTVERISHMAPGSALSRAYLATALFMSGDADGAIDAYRQALAIDPRHRSVWSMYLFMLINLDHLDPDWVFAEHRRFGEQVESAWRERWGGWTVARDPARRLRLGFVSGDLRNHAVAFFIEPIWATLDRERFELVIYHNHPFEDEVSARLRAGVDAWLNVSGLDDDALEARIRQDQIDVLFDLSGHTDYDRLTVFARKPAPVQISWIGYPGTTGLEAIDYRLISAVPGTEGLDRWFSEKLVRLPPCFLFEPPPDLPAVSPLPVTTSGVFTFGSFNRISKITPRTLELWCSVLRAVPDSRLLIGNLNTDAQREALLGSFAAQGIEVERIVFRLRSAMGEYLGMHAEVDLLLDAVPYGGGTTTSLALCMGVPTLTLTGVGLQQWMGAQRMHALGLEEWAVPDESAFVARAVAASSEHEALARLRASLRDRIVQAKRSERRARLDEALRLIWRRWCAGEPPAPIRVD